MAKKNDVLIVETELNRLVGMAEAMEQRNVAEAEHLLAKLDNALTISEAKAPKNLVRMGSRVTYEIDGEEKIVSVVFPAEADYAAGRVSVSSLLGIALIGHRAGANATLHARNGKKIDVRIVAVKDRAEEFA
mgnify:CR=1 FL=1